MNTKWIYKIAGFAAVVAVFALSSCNDDDVAFSVDTADVVTLKKTIGGEVKYAAAYYAYATQPIAAATVTTPGGQTLSLAKYPANSQSFYLEPGGDDGYSATAPQEGSYLFSVTSDKGETLTGTDNHQFDDIDFAVIDSMGYNQTGAYLYLRWNKVTGADSYVALLLNAAGDIVFNGYALDATKGEEFGLSPQYNTGVWAAQPVNGATYTLRVEAIKYDFDATQSDMLSSIQEMSISDTTITWTGVGN